MRSGSTRSAHRTRMRRWTPVALALLAVLAWPTTMTVGGEARLEGAVQRTLAAPQDGFVQRVHARPGETVRAGAALIDLSDQSLQLDRARLASQLAQHMDAYAAAQARADRAELAQQQARADETQAELALVDEKLARARIVAPFDAVVLQGDWSQQLGAPVQRGVALMTLAPVDRYRVIVQVDQRDVGFVAVGQSGTLTLAALPWRTLPLQVERIAAQAVAGNGRAAFEVEARLAATADGLRPGLQGQGQIEVGEAPTLWRWTRRGVQALAERWWALGWP